LNLGYLPRVRILHSSETEIGQIYVPSMNWILFAGTVLLVLVFRSSDALAGAYGIAVSATMLMAGVMVDMLSYITQQRRRWVTLSLLATITLIDAAFFSSNVLRVVEGGWFPIAVALVIYALMTTWNEGRRTINWTISMEQSSSQKFMEELASKPPARVQGTAVYLASAASTIPRAMMQSIRFLGSLHERNIILTFSSAEVPTIDAHERITTDTLAPGLYRVTARYGFMEQPNAVAVLKAAGELGLPYKPEETVFIVGRDTPIVTTKRGMAPWRKRLFALMARNSQLAAVHFGIPPHKTLEIGTQTPL
jgi:KUP system potassium uptake protein